MKNIKLSLIIPIFEYQTEIDESLHSISNQTQSNLEYIFVTNSTNKDIQNKLNAFKKENEEVKIFKRKHINLNIVNNIGLKKSNGEYIIFLKPNSIIKPEMCQELYTKANTNNSDIVISDIEEIDAVSNTKELIPSRFNEHKTYSITEDKELLAFVNGVQSNKIYKLDLFVDNKISFNDKYESQDITTQLKVLIQSKSISFINKPLISIPKINIPENSTTADEFSKQINDLTNYFKKENKFSEYYEELKFITVERMIDTFKSIDFKCDTNKTNLFIDSTFKNVKDIYPDFKTSKYSFFQNINDSVFLSCNLLKSYFRYNSFKTSK